MKVLDCISLGQMCESLLDGEPVFIIRAQDKAAIAALSAYLEATKTEGGSNTSRTWDARQKFIDWQRDNPKRVKAAD